MYRSHKEQVEHVMRVQAKLYGDIAKMSRRVIAGDKPKKVKK
jgi:hypothetical protein